MGKDHKKWPGFCVVEIASPIAIVVARYYSYTCPCTNYGYFYIFRFILTIKLIALLIILEKVRVLKRKYCLLKISISTPTQDLCGGECIFS